MRTAFFTSAVALAATALATPARGDTVAPDDDAVAPPRVTSGELPSTLLALQPAAPVAGTPVIVAAPATAPVASPPATSAADAAAATADAAGADTVGAETIEIVDRPPPGAQSTVDQATLERSEHDDIHKVLAQVPGVYVREEDGYGLRPNIGMRGAAAERSAKVALMEDGVLIAPAPYSAPAAYYFPLVTRMSRVEVVKGPAAIVYGPNTVGGAVNLVGEPMPGERGGYLDVAGGSDRYGKLHLRAAERGQRWGLDYGAMAEYVKLRTDGFKQLDDGGPTGFDKNDAQLSLRVASLPTAHAYHQLDARIGLGTEVSHETYTGLSDDDFARAPQRRYLASQDDRMHWHHWRFRASHRFELGSRLSIETTAYRHQFHRIWGKVDGFIGQRDFYGLISHPDQGSNSAYYQVLTGQADTASPEEELVRGTNDRAFVSQGVQTIAQVEAQLGPTAHRVDAGVRVHFDSAHRKRFEDAYAMVARELMRTARAEAIALDTTAETLAIAVHGQDHVTWRDLEVTAGTRVELIDPSFVDHQHGTAQNVDGYVVIIPGGGAQYALTDALSVLAGVHRGFVPVAPSASTDVQPESSVNYEAGARWRDDHLRAELIGFYSDYSNLKGACSYSSGCTSEQEGAEFNGGRVHIHGVEASAAVDLSLPRSLRAPLAATYTLTRSAFQSAFSSEFAGWGKVDKGDELPYLPVHQASLSTAVVAERWELGAALRWHGAVRDQAGQGAIPDDERADALLTVDLSAHLRLGVWGELYGTCDNVTDEQVIVSRRPYGARPNAPRLFVVGYKARL